MKTTLPHTTALASLAILGLFLLAPGCEAPWDDEASSPDGTSTVRGRITAFDFGAVTVRLDRPVADAATPFSAFREAAALLIPDAAANTLGDITVYIRETDISTLTAGDGSFVLSGVPAGTHELGILWGGREAVYTFSVGDNQQLELVNMRVLSDGTVRVDSERLLPLSSPTTTSSSGTSTTSASAGGTTSGTGSSGSSSTTTSQEGGLVEMPR